MVAKKEFKLQPDLETLVKLVNNAKILEKRAYTNPNLDNVDLRKTAEEQVNFLYHQGYVTHDGHMLTEYSPTEFIEAVKDTRGQLLRTLDTRIDDQTYRAAKNYFTSGLDDNIKNGLYTDLVSKGIMPNAPAGNAKQEEKNLYKKLQLAKRTLDFAEKLEILATRGDSSGAAEEAQRYSAETGEIPFDEFDVRALARADKYGTQAAQENKKQVLHNIAQAHRKLAGKLIKEGNLYSLIDKGVEDKQYGKAIALNSFYNAYNFQQEVNKQKEAEERARK